MRFDYAKLTATYNTLEERAFGRGDADYVLHELSHYVVLFRRAPCVVKSELYMMQCALDMMTCGQAQLHELRAVKLHAVTLGVAAKPILAQVMWGIFDAAANKERGQIDVVTSLTKGMNLMRDMHISPRLVRAYRLAILRFAQ